MYRLERFIGWAIYAFIIATSGCLPKPSCVEHFDVDDGDITILTWNIGNSTRELNYPLRLKDRRYEHHIGVNIRALKPDIVALQEVLPPTACAGFSETESEHSCFDTALAPIQRILGPEYSIVCDQRAHIECIGVHVNFGSIQGLPLGAFDLNGAQTLPLPGPACDYLANKCTGPGKGCDSESTVSKITIETVDGQINVIHAHPTAIGRRCLQKQISQSFGEVHPNLPTVLVGDWNFDPTRPQDAALTTIWSRFVGKTKRFSEHSQREFDCRLRQTSVGQRANLDRVVTNFADGRCQVWSNPRLDDGFDFEHLIGGRADHFAVICNLAFSNDDLQPRVDNP